MHNFYFVFFYVLSSILISVKKNNISKEKYKILKGKVIYVNIVPIISAMQRNNQNSNNRRKKMERNAFDYSYLINEDGKAEPLESFCNEEELAMFERIDKARAERKKRQKIQEVIAYVVCFALLFVCIFAYCA